MKPALLPMSLPAPQDNHPALSPALLGQWQASVDLLAETGRTGGVVIARLQDGAVEVLVASRNAPARLPAGVRLPLASSDFHDIAPARSGDIAHVLAWRSIARQAEMTHCIGQPLHWPDGTLFGTLCALNVAPEDFQRHFANLLAQATHTFEAELAVLHDRWRLQSEMRERELVERELLESERQLAEAQRLARLGSWHLDLLTGKLTWSDEIFRLIERDPREFAGSYASFLDFVHPDDRAMLDAVYQDSVRHGREYQCEHRMLMADGRIKWVIERGRTRYAGDGTPLASYGTVQDISERKAQEGERDMLAGIVRHSQELVNVATLDGRMVFLNETGRHMLGIQPGDVAGHHILDVIPPDWRPLVEQQLLPQLLAHGHWEGDLQYRNLQTGELRDVHAICFKIIDPETGEFTRLANVSQDITERVRAQARQQAFAQQLQHTQKLESLGLMASGIAHDFNNLLQAVLGNLELARSDLADSHPALAAVDRSLLATRRAASITRQLLTFAGQDRGELERTDLRAAVTESIDMLRAAIDKRVGIDGDIAAGALPVNAIPGQLQQVIVNLVTNAADAMNGSGTVRVQCRALSIRDPLEDLNDIGGPLLPGHYAAITVTDDGCGMDATTRACIFDPFFTTKAHGRGLGMPAVLGILRAAGGHINVRSTPGAGTAIRVCWPMQRQEHGGEQPPAQSASSPLAGRHVLVVDDEDTLRMVAAELLRRQGARVVTAASGTAALAVLQDAACAIDAVILDITMPDLDGADTFHLLRQGRPGLPVLLTSGYDAPGALARIGSAPRTAFLGKPWLANDLFHALTTLLLQDD